MCGPGRANVSRGLTRPSGRIPRTRRGIHGYPSSHLYGSCACGTHTSIRRTRWVRPSLSSGACDPPPYCVLMTSTVRSFPRALRAVLPVLIVASVACAESEADPTGPNGQVAEPAINQIVTYGPLNASSTDTLVHFSFATGGLVAKTGDWDLAFRRYELRLNSPAIGGATSKNVLGRRAGQQQGGHRCAGARVHAGQHARCLRPGARGTDSGRRPVPDRPPDGEPAGHSST